MSGRGTSGGVVFQAEVGACLTALLLTERPLERVGTGLLGIPQKIGFETGGSIDDIQVDTNLGQIFIQAKRTISLSKKPGGELASVALQFVRQFRAGIIEKGLQRDLNPASDRLILAVGDEAPNTIVVDLYQTLERNRTRAATALPEKLVSALNIFSELISKAWLDEAGTPISGTEKQAILSICTVIKIGESQKQLATEILQQVVEQPGDEITLYGLLVKWAAKSSESGVGGNAASIRLALQSEINLKEAPSFKDDVTNIYAYNRKVLQRLKRFTELNTPDGSITISRPVVELVIEAARQESLIITGEPGSGKSSVIYHVAEALGKEHKVVTLTVEANSISLDALQHELQLKHSLVNVMEQMTSDKPSYLILDALDAVRGGLAEATYKKLVREVTSLPGWRIIVSVRTFDLRLGKEWRALFPGKAPWPDYSDKTFSNVRHVHVGLLNDQENIDLAAKSPILSTAIIAAGPRMKMLTKNPFNLGLVADLLHTGLSAEALALVKTRGQLLERYWEERIAEFGLPATVALKAIVSLMVNSRSIDLPETEIPMDTATTVDNLQKAGVLITEQSRRVAFRHHILFDYATARLMLLPDQAQAVKLLGKENGLGLLIAPSLGYWLEELKNNSTASEYWTLILSLIGDDTTDPIIRVEIARLAIEAISPEESLVSLANLINEKQTTYNRAFNHLVNTLFTKKTTKQLIETGPWTHFISELSNPGEEQLGNIRTLIAILLDLPNSPEGLKAIGKASRNLFDALSVHERFIPWLSPHVIQFVARTYTTDPVASRERLDTTFLESRFKRFGHIEIPSLAREVLSFAGCDSDFIAKLYYRVFLGGNFSHEAVTSMSNSWILSLTSNAAQDFNMAAHSLSEVYPKLIEQFPQAGIRAFAATLRGEREGRHPARKNHQTLTLSLGNEERRLDPDLSHVWAWNIGEKGYDYYAKIYQSFIDGILAINDIAILQNTPNLVLQETGIALAWRALFEIGAERPKTLGKLLWRSAADMRALTLSDTRQAAINLLGKMFPHLTVIEREEVENEWLQYDFSDFQDPETARIKLLGTLFNNIGQTQLVTQAAKNFLKDAQDDERHLENEPLFKLESGWSRDERHWLEQNGVNVADEKTAGLIALNDSLKVTKDDLKENETKENGLKLWQQVMELVTAIEGSGNIIEGLLNEEVSQTLIEGIGIALAKNYVPDDKQEEAVSRLLELSHHTNPQSDENTEENFSRHMSWGSPAPRVEAAEAIAKLVLKPNLWPKIQNRFQSLLLDDPHPAVRFQVAGVIPWIEKIDVEATWSLVKRFFEKETNTSVISHALSGLARIASREAVRLEPYIINVSKQTSPPESGDDIATGLIMFFAIHKGLPASQELINSWINNFSHEEKRLYSALFDIRENLVLGFKNSEPKDIEVKNRTLKFIWSLLNKLEPTVEALALSNKEPTEEEKIALKLFDGIADQLRFTIDDNKLVDELESDDAKRKFLNHYSPLISKLTTLGTPRAIHYLLELVGNFIDIEPKLCFDLISEALLRKTGVAQYQHEHMGADLFVRLISLFLADYRFIFSEDEARIKLIECLALFADAGWPEARQLFQSLPELLQ